MSYITKIVTSNYSTDIFLSRKKEKKAAIQKRDYYKKGLLQKGQRFNAAFFWYLYFDHYTTRNLWRDFLNFPYFTGFSAN